MWKSYFRKCCKCTKWPQMILNNTRSNLLHICSTSTASPKWHSILLYHSPFPRHLHFFFILLLATMLNFNLFLFLNTKFQNTKNKKKTYFIWTVIKNNCKKFGCKRILSAEEAQFWKSCFQKNHVKSTEWSQNGLEWYKAKGTIYMFKHWSRVPNFTPFCCTVAWKKIQDKFENVWVRFLGVALSHFHSHQVPC